MNNSKQILDFLSSTRHLEHHNNQQLNLNMLEIRKSFDLFIKRFNNCDSYMLSKDVNSMIKILNRVPIVYFALVLSEIDERFPGLSFYYVMEARQSDDIEKLVFMKSLQIFEQSGLLKEIFSPKRLTLIKGLLDGEENEKSTYQSKQNLIEQINNSFNLSLEQIESIKDILLLGSTKREECNLPVLSGEDILLLLDSTLNENDKQFKKVSCS